MFGWNPTVVPVTDYSFTNLQKKLAEFDSSQQSIQGKQ